MNREDLRVGNYVHTVLKTYDGLSKDLATIQCIHMNVVQTKESGTWAYHNQIEGIRLDKTWLAMFGFVNNGYGGFEKSWKPNIYSDLLITYRVGMSMQIGFSIYEGSYEIKNSIEYVHELQNLWYHLTRNDELVL